MVKFEEQLEVLGAMPRARLKQEWERVYKEPAPNLSADLLRLGIAYRLQEKVRGSLPRASLFQLQEGRGGQAAIDRKLRRKASEVSPLAGMIYDGHGRAMSPSHTVRKGKRYRYYVTHPGKVIDDTPAWRLPAFDIEKRVIGTLADYLQAQQAIRKLVGTRDAD